MNTHFDRLGVQLVRRMPLAQLRSLGPNATAFGEEKNGQRSWQAAKVAI